MFDGFYCKGANNEYGTTNISNIKLRPEMYIGNANLEHMVHFMYHNAISNKNDVIDLAFRVHFHDWIKIQLEKCMI